MKRKNVFGLLLCLALSQVQAQTYRAVGMDVVQKEFANLSKAYNAENMELRYTKTMYPNIGDQLSATTSKGVIYRGVGNQYRVEEPGTFLVQNQDLKMQVDSANQMVVISKNDSIFTSVQLEEMLEKIKEGAYSVLRKEENKLVYYQITPQNKAEGITVICFNPSDGFIRSVQITLPTTNYYMDDLEDQTLETPSILMSYERPQKIQDKNLFNLNQWLVLNQGKVELQPAFAAFKIHDSRLPQIKNN